MRHTCFFCAADDAVAVKICAMVWQKAWMARPKCIPVWHYQYKSIFLVTMIINNVYSYHCVCHRIYIGNKCCVVCIMTASTFQFWYTIFVFYPTNLPVIKIDACKSLYWLYLASVNPVILMNISLQTYLRFVVCTYLVSIAICEIMLFYVEG